MKKCLGLWLALWVMRASAYDVLHLYNWNNYLTDATVARFEAQCHCKVVQDYYGSMEEMLAKLAAGARGYDVVIPTGFAIEPLQRQGLLAALDKKQLPALEMIAPAFLNTAFDPGNRYTVPYAFTTTLVGYNAERIKALGLDPSSWAILFDPQVLQKIKGRVTVLDDARELFAAALLYNGFSANSVNRDEWARARDTILKAKPYWAAFNAQSYIKELTIGNIWVAHGYSSDMFQAANDARAAKRPFTIAYGLQKEGNTLSLDSMAILKSAPRPDLAQQFIAFMLEGRNAAELTNLIGSGNPNLAALPFVRADIRANLAVFPDAKARQKLAQLQSLDGKSLRELNKLWTQIKTAR